MPSGDGENGNDSMTLSDIGVIVAIILSAVTALASGLAWLANRRRRKADLNSVEIGNLVRLSQRLQELEDARDEDYRQITQQRKMLKDANERITTLELEYAALMREHKEYKRGVKILVRQLRRHNITPEWTPPGEESS